jgi:hypothetical protein
MSDFDAQIANRKPVIIVFAVISALSTAATAIVPFIAYS